jgi:hypothetical protein
MHSIFPARLRIILALAAIAALATVVGLSVTSRPAAKALSDSALCASTINPGQRVVLDANVTCSSTEANPVVTVIGPAVLDLNGFTLSCPTNANRDAHVGIAIQGTGAIVKNGHILHCHEGVLVEGNGFHRVSNLEVAETLDNQTGIVVESNYNLIFRNDVHDNLSTGILVNGNANVIKRNNVHDNFFSEGEGISIVGNKNVVIWNIANFNGFEPISNDGIDVSGDRNLIALNTTNENYDDGIDVSGQKNIIIFNRSFLNGLTAAQQIVFNLSSSIGGDPNGENWDMEDGNGNCDSNFWRWNSFGTSDPDCIR